MIASLSGKLRRRSADSVIIDVAGVGYLVAVPLSTSGALPGEGEDVTLHIHTHLREDAISLFGFATETEKDLFLVLLGVSGIGPKLALAVLSGLAPGEIVAAISAGDDAKLTAIPGVGRKTAARICLELKDKVRQLLPAAHPAETARPAAEGLAEDALSALVNLGYKRQQAEEAVKRVLQRSPDAGVEELIRKTLGVLTGR